MKRVIGHLLIAFGKIANKCKSAYLYSLVNTQGGGYIGAETVLIFPSNIYIGNRSYINGGMIAACPDAKIIIGNDCMISYAVRDCGGNPGPNPSYATSPKSLRYCMGLL